MLQKMTYMIMNRMGTERPDALIATVITSYAMSSIITGIVCCMEAEERIYTDPWTGVFRFRLCEARHVGQLVSSTERSMDFRTC